MSGWPGSSRGKCREARSAVSSSRTFPPATWAPCLCSTTPAYPPEVLNRGTARICATRPRGPSGPHRVRRPADRDIPLPLPTVLVQQRRRADMTRQAETPALSRRQILVAFSGLLLAMLLAALDQTIVATALPTIAGDLGGINRLSWVVTAYLLASTASTPLWGKIGDLYGRKRLLLTAMVIFLAGSAACGLAHNMNELIGFRAVQGIGAGGLMTMAMAVVGDLVSPRERGK